MAKTSLTEAWAGGEEDPWQAAHMDTAGRAEGWDVAGTGTGSSGSMVGMGTLWARKIGGKTFKYEYVVSRVLFFPRWYQCLAAGVGTWVKTGFTNSPSTRSQK